MISVTHARPIPSSEKEHVRRAKEVTEFNLELLSPNTFCYNFAGEKADRARSAPARSKAKAKTSGGAAREKHFPSARINFAQLRALKEELVVSAVAVIAIVTISLEESPVLFSTLIKQRITRAAETGCMQCINHAPVALTNEKSKTRVPKLSFWRFIFASLHTGGEF
jgi:hypothetical protein